MDDNVLSHMCLTILLLLLHEWFSVQNVSSFLVTNIMNDWFVYEFCENEICKLSQKTSVEEIKK